MYIALFWAMTLNFWVPPSRLKIDFKSFFGFKAILGHEGGTQKLKVTAQNKAIQISFWQVQEKIWRL